ncbi:quinone oxidoreductase [Paracoccidioides lutzii Pb01]|uniref:Quinone oxidoreductase n=1 Tax=Paracoccidioides lutzii (strain ATCC MYA-826 / Pb01) TaxID=502779 RepID=C1GP48_PARBA|nr:quinone oxidoreductase [Paracoccidioides lutzii Pb01]EEH35970.2 quinone oxidoreductase [Paracoccidioides lutzii Pb01]
MFETLINTSASDIRGGKGPAANLFVNTIPKPVSAAGEALVKIKAFGLNRMDLLQREGMYPVPPLAPSTLGVEFSGVIKSLGGGDCLDFKVGDEVFGLAYGGAYAEYISSSVQTLLHKPVELSWVEAAGIPETWFTAAQAMYLVAQFEPGKSILWHAGASAVSISGIQLSKADNASSIYITAGSQEKINFCVSTLGATAGFNYKTQDWAAEVKKATGGRGVDVIIDFVGASYFQGNLDAAALDGCIANLAFLGGTKLPAGVDISAFLRKRLKYEGSSLRSRDSAYQRQLRDLLLNRIMPKFKDGTFKVYIEKVFPFEKVVDAHLLLESNQTKGKIICTIGED